MSLASQQVVSWARKAREATTRRDESIRAAQIEGMSLRQIARAAGLSHTAISNILRRTASL